MYILGSTDQDLGGRDIEIAVLRVALDLLVVGGLLLLIPLLSVLPFLFLQAASAVRNLRAGDVPREFLAQPL